MKDGTRGLPIEIISRENLLAPPPGLKAGSAEVLTSKPGRALCQAASLCVPEFEVSSEGLCALLKLNKDTLRVSHCTAHLGAPFFKRKTRSKTLFIFYCCGKETSAYSLFRLLFRIHPFIYLNNKKKVQRYLTSLSFIHSPNFWQEVLLVRILDCLQIRQGDVLQMRLKIQIQDKALDHNHFIKINKHSIKIYIY